MRTTRGEACHWILGCLRLPMNPVPLPPLEMTIIVYRQPVLLAECGWGHLERGLESDGFAAGTSDGQTADRSRGFVADGILMTLTPKQTIASAGGGCEIIELKQSPKRCLTQTSQTPFSVVL